MLPTTAPRIALISRTTLPHHLLFTSSASLPADLWVSPRYTRVLKREPELFVLHVLLHGWSELWKADLYVLLCHFLFIDLWILTPDFLTLILFFSPLAMEFLMDQGILLGMNCLIDDEDLQGVG